MKVLLTSAVAAMVAAGMYGAHDFYRDVKNGTLITHTKGVDHALQVNRIVAVHATSDTVAKPLTQPAPTNSPRVGEFELNEESFSRAALEPELEPEEELIIQNGMPGDTGATTVFVSPQLATDKDTLPHEAMHKQETGSTDSTTAP